MTDQTQLKPNGPPAAAVIATGIGATVLGLMTTLSEYSKDFSKFLDFSKNYGIGSGVGPLSGKVIIAVAAYFISWFVLALLWRGKEVNFNRAFMIGMILVAVGFALTFPPIFLAFEKQ